MERSWNALRFAALTLLAAACAVPSQSAQPQAQSTSRPVATSTAAPGAQPAPASAKSAPARPAAAAPARAEAGDTMLPTKENSVRFAVLGDTGTGERAQYDVGAMLNRSRGAFPFEFVIMVGDNMYGSERPQDYLRKFEMPYKPLLDANISFYASLGNHDDPNQKLYKYFNMNGERYYTFKKDKLGNPGVRFFALDSNYMSRDQVEWLERELKNSGSDWKIAFFHHPLYSSGGRHGSEVDLRQQLEPLFLKYGVNVVFAGHEHFYERIHPQKGIYYFTAGGSAKLRAGDIQKTPLTAKGFDSDYTYMLVEVAGDVMNFQTLTRGGKQVDAGAIARSNQSVSK
jgi:hypothetical protein